MIVLDYCEGCRLANGRRRCDKLKFQLEPGEVVSVRLQPRKHKNCTSDQLITIWCSHAEVPTTFDWKCYTAFHEDGFPPWPVWVHLVGFRWFALRSDSCRSWYSARVVVLPDERMQHEYRSS